MPEFYRLGMTKEEINDTLQAAVLEPKLVVAGNFAAFTEAGQIIDSEKSAADFAPGGFGIGGAGVHLTSKDDLNQFFEKNGWYYWGNDVPQNGPPASWGSVATYCSMMVTDGTQIAFTLNYGTIMVRRYSAGAFGPWECINPPMQLEVEYRTTDRYCGKPLYAKLVNYGALPGNDSSYVEIGDDVERVFIDISRSTLFKTERGDDGYYNELPINTGIKSMVGSYGRINIRTDSSTASLWSAYIYCRYTKISD